MASSISADSGLSSGTSGIKITSDNTGVLALQSGNNTTAITVDTSQNVGIGTTSPSFTAGSNGLMISGTKPALRLSSTTTGSGTWEIYADSASSGGLGFYERQNNQTAMYLDEGGNAGIGTTSPSTRLSLQLSSATTYTTSTRTNQGLTIYNSSATTNGFTGIEFSGEPTSGNGGIAGIGSVVTASGSANLVFGTRDSATYAERMRIDSSGNLLLGTTSAAGTSTFNIVRPANTATYIYMLKNTQLEMTMGAKSSTDTNFYIGSGSSTIGQNGVYLTAAGNSWNAVSDERQKNIIETIENGLEKVNALRAVIGSYKHDTKEIRRPFLIAQDVQAVLPEAVNIQDEETGTLGMSYTDTIPLLVAAIKELKAINDQQAETINALTARVVALEGK